MKTRTCLKKVGKTLAILFLAATTTVAMQGCFLLDDDSDTDTEEEVIENTSNKSKLVFKNLRLEENAMEEGEEMLKCYFEAEFPKLKGHEVRISMYVLDSEGEWISYEDDEGFGVPVCDTRWYSDGVATDNWMGVSYEELEFLPSGKYYVRFEAYDNTAREDLGYSKTVPFKL